MDWRRPWVNPHDQKSRRTPRGFRPSPVRKEHAEAGDPLRSKWASPANPSGICQLGRGAHLSLHGTNNRRRRRGHARASACIPMMSPRVPLIPVGTTVRLINEPVKVAWVDGELLLEAHPPVDAQRPALTQSR